MFELFRLPPPSPIKGLLVLLSAAGILLAGPIVGAQEQLAEPPESADAMPALMSVLNDSGYVLGAGDVISLEDEQMGKLGTGATNILTDGTVDLPLVGHIHLAGLSIEDAQSMLNDIFKQYFVNPSINITVDYQRPTRVYVMGAVENPGIFVSGTNLKTGAPSRFEVGSANKFAFFYRFYLMDAIIQAGGLKPNANIRDIKIHRMLPKAQTIHVNLWELLKNGNIVQDFPLRDQDQIEISALSQEQMASDEDWKYLSRTNIGSNFYEVNVIGAVRKPGTYKVGSQDSILDVVAQAGGLDERSDAEKVFILRANSAGQVFKKRVDLSDEVMKGKKQGERLTLLPEDVIFVDESGSKKVLGFSKGFVGMATNAAVYPFFRQILRFDK